MVFELFVGYLTWLLCLVCACCFLCLSWAGVGLIVVSFVDVMYICYYLV